MTTEVITTTPTTKPTTKPTNEQVTPSGAPVPWGARPVVGFDTETTGVDVDTDRIVTAAVVRREGGTTTVTTWLLDPGVPIPEAATAIHGITTQRARSAGRPAAAALEEIATALVDALAHGEAVVAYNACFDLSLLDVELHRHGLPTLGARLGRPVRTVLDPLVLDRHLDAGREGARRLGDLCGHYGVRTRAELHAADVDVLATLGVLDALATTFPALGSMTADALHDLQAEAYARWVAEVTAARAEAGREGPRPEPGWPTRAAGAAAQPSGRRASSTRRATSGDDAATSPSAPSPAR